MYRILMLIIPNLLVCQFVQCVSLYLVNYFNDRFGFEWDDDIILIRITAIDRKLF